MFALLGRAMARDGDGHVPLGGRERAELRKRYRRAAVESVPAGLRRRTKGREWEAIVSRVEGAVRVNHAQQCAHGLADASSFGGEIVFDAAADPDARDILVHHEAQPLCAHPDPFRKPSDNEKLF
jgi:hypothetical protein